MGYLTTYTMDGIMPYPTEEVEKEMVKTLMEIWDYDYDEPETFDDFLSECMKWYEYAEDMTKLSAKYPDYLFILSGKGEESGDIWTHYFKGGKSQHCPATIIIDEFDENKLK